MTVVTVAIMRIVHYYVCIVIARYYADYDTQLYIRDVPKLYRIVLKKRTSC